MSDLDCAYALTLQQPWATCIAHHGKDIENRTWLPHQRVIGQRIAIHAGKRYRRDIARSLEEGVAGCPLLGELLEDVPLGAVVAVARVRGYALIGEGLAGWSSGLSEDDYRRALESPWWVGPVGWLLGDVEPLVEPVPARGRQGLWRLGEVLRGRVLGQLGGMAS